MTKAKSYPYLILTAVVVNVFNILLGTTSSYLFDKFVGEDEKRPVWKKRLINFSFGVAFTILVGQIGISRIQNSVLETSTMVLDNGTDFI